MEPASFEQATTVLGPPSGMSEDQVHSLKVHVAQWPDGSTATISCWKPTREELDEIEKTGRVWLFVFGTGMPPVAMTGFSPFAEARGA